MVSNTSRVFTMFWFSANCKLCLTHGHDFSKTTYPAVRNSSRFFLQNFHLNLLRCRCRNTKRFSASLNNCLGKLVQIAITDQNAWAFGDESRDREIWILCNTSLAWQRLHMMYVFAPKGSHRLAMEATKFSALWGIHTVGLNLFPTKDRNAEEMLTKGFNDHFVDIECIDYSWIFNFDCCVSSFLNNRARESRFFYRMKKLTEFVHNKCKTLLRIASPFWTNIEYSHRIPTSIFVEIVVGGLIDPSQSTNCVKTSRFSSTSRHDNFPNKSNNKAKIIIEITWHF